MRSTHAVCRARRWLARRRTLRVQYRTDGERVQHRLAVRWPALLQAPGPSALTHAARRARGGGYILRSTPGTDSRPHPVRATVDVNTRPKAAGTRECSVYVHTYGCMCVRVCVQVCVRACVQVCVRVCVRLCVRVWPRQLTCVWKRLGYFRDRHRCFSNPKTHSTSFRTDSAQSDHATLHAASVHLTGH